MGSNPAITSANFDGNDGDTYAFRVRAYDTAGNEGAWSAEVETTIDATDPTSQASAPANSQTADFTVTWSGSDECVPDQCLPSGIVSYDVQYKDGDGAWTGWQTDTSAISATFSGQMRHTYHFQSRARDLAGLVEVWPIQPDASTSVGPLITKYYYHGGKRVAMRRGGVVQYLHGDHLGSTSLTTDESGGMVARQLYHPYGTTRYSEGTLATDFGFTGQRKDGTGLVFMHARYYHPALGRWTQADTIAPGVGSQGLNRYMYVRGNPVLYNDPSGHVDPGTVIIIVGLIVVGLTSCAPPPTPETIANTPASTIEPRFVSDIPISTEWIEAATLEWRDAHDVEAEAGEISAAGGGGIGGMGGQTMHLDNSQEISLGVAVNLIRGGEYIASYNVGEDQFIEAGLAGTGWIVDKQPFDKNKAEEYLQYGYPALFRMNATYDGQGRAIEYDGGRYTTYLLLRRIEDGLVYFDNPVDADGEQFLPIDDSPEKRWDFTHTCEYGIIRLSHRPR